VKGAVKGAVGGVRVVGRGYGAAAARAEMRVERGSAATAATAGREEVEGDGVADGARTGGGPGRARAAETRRRSLS
jgi:Mg-chelatase subunit ChlI